MSPDHSARVAVELTPESRDEASMEQASCWGPTSVAKRHLAVIAAVLLAEEMAGYSPS
jgi:hypothetical protein